MYSAGLPCAPVNFHVFLCIAVYARVLPCTPVYSRVLPCTAMYSRVLPFTPVYSRALPCAPVEKYLDLQEAGRCAEVIGDDRDALNVTKQEMIKHALAL